ncbi:sugar ABC transporter permease [Paenibacillus sp.]|uniref:sugar ABC transporter permease n=1 Tax=Paenibacillus sp. TaxID=58172 RepID=UPI002D489460|nr:sugar ABC transporter permease [Paenibacillus sp.]HZG56332.1 sugar ABC transporter permease [Paenibacillus sp.]
MKRKGYVGLTLSYLTLSVLVILALYPALWIIMSSFKFGDSLYSETLIPTRFTLEHYRDLFADTDYPLWFMNTLKIAVLSTIFGTFLSTLTSYAMSRYRFAGRKHGLTVALVLQMFPGFMAMIAVYIFLNQLQLLNNHWALILVYSAGAILSNIWIGKGFYDSIPRSLEEAARIDGAGHWTIFFKIMLPLTRPMITYVGLMIFNGAWVDFIFAQLILRTEEQRTLAVGLWQMVSSYQSTQFTMFAAGAVIVAIPVTLLFIFLQRFLIQGLTAGASKG